MSIHTILTDNSPFYRTVHVPHGTVVPNAGTPAKQPSSSLVLTGKHVTLEPLNLDKHGPTLFKHFSESPVQDGPRVKCIDWSFLSKGPFNTYEEFAAAYRALSSKTFDGNGAAVHHPSEQMQFYAFIPKSSGEPCGVGALFRCDAPNRVIEIGHLTLCPHHLQGTMASKEAFYLLFRHVFDELGHRRLEWKCNAMNNSSRISASKFGFCFEGVFRHHLIRAGNGVNRDTAWYSMLFEDWEGFIRQGFEKFLQGENPALLTECLLASHKEYHVEKSASKNQSAGDRRDREEE